jgi:cardiolipin synthase
MAGGVVAEAAPGLLPTWVLTLIWVGYYGLGLLAIAHILRQRKEPMAGLSWILGILLLPFLGLTLYFLIGERRVKRRVRKRKRRRRREHIARAIQAASRATAAGEGTSGPGLVEGADEELLALVRLSTKLSQSPLTGGNSVQIFTSAQETYDDILRSIDTATHHIHLEYYIFRPDETGKCFVERLAEKARAGVEVRLLLDAIGAWRTTRRFLKPLIEAGGKVETFLPAIPLRRHWHINCRNHRKIVIVDGETAYTGSQNIGDEYRGRRRDLAPWHDTHLRLDGPAARELQEIFVEDWYFACEEELTGAAYLRRPASRGRSLVQIVPSGPDQQAGVLSHIFFSAISLARNTIRIATPYFVPDPGLILALQHAAYRGLRVEIVIPTKTDSLVALWAGRSFYQELVRAGVCVWEYDHGMLHSKTVSIDDRWTMVSSANMDIRSFLLNFEVTASIFDQAIAGRVGQDFAEKRDGSRRIQPLEDGAAPLFPSLIEGAARLLSPIL